MVSNNSRICIFGEVLFDHFPASEPVLGGAPFNVAWHLQAFGVQPRFISAVGADSLGEKVTNAMSEWGMDTSYLQLDKEHGTGVVDIELRDNEPVYTICDDVAYDHVNLQGLPEADDASLVYHGTLALRHENNRETLKKLVSGKNNTLFIDVNLREPWWDRDFVLAQIQGADCVKLNSDELQLLGGDFAPDSDESEQAAAKEFRVRNRILDLVVTRGDKGAFIVDRFGRCLPGDTPARNPNLVDTVGAGDAFSSIVILGMLNGWDWRTTLCRAQEFASHIVSQQGAVCRNIAVYQDLGQRWQVR
ncbi:MAG: carbohydrate kinase [Gammaproteobacteria bacterium]|nr:MAG: carbohydrate kinase [Pseudomonadota bacterium]PIE38443.1 MAG: carbohydrate kinase [Gammaproteobacteria bacterium]